MKPKDLDGKDYKDDVDGYDAGIVSGIPAWQHPADARDLKRFPEDTDSANSAVSRLNQENADPKERGRG